MMASWKAETCSKVLLELINVISLNRCVVTVSIERFILYRCSFRGCCLSTGLHDITLIRSPLFMWRMAVGETGSESVDWIHLAQDSVQWRALVKTATCWAKQRVASQGRLNFTEWVSTMRWIRFTCIPPFNLIATEPEWNSLDNVQCGHQCQIDWVIETSSLWRAQLSRSTLPHPPEDGHRSSLRNVVVFCKTATYQTMDRVEKKPNSSVQHTPSLESFQVYPET
jgi:hypothetical protein